MSTRFWLAVPVLAATTLMQPRTNVPLPHASSAAVQSTPVAPAQSTSTLDDQTELAVTVEENQLVIRGRQQEPEDKRFLHRGIAARQFLRAFVLADGIEVKSAALQNVLLRIDLVRPQAEPSVRVIEINGDKS